MERMAHRGIRRLGTVSQGTHTGTARAREGCPVSPVPALTTAESATAMHRETRPKCSTGCFLYTRAAVEVSVKPA